jgi:hypothetical protein
MKRILSLTVLALACGAAAADAPVRNAAYYTSSFDGGDLQFAKAECKTPNIPSHSVSPEGARRVEKAVKNWRACFSGWKDKLLAVLPAGKEIPESVARTMSPADLEKARAHMNEVYSNIVADALAQDDKINETIEAWMSASRDYNKGLGLPRDARDRMERDRDQYLSDRNFYSNPYNLLPKRPK